MTKTPPESPRRTQKMPAGIPYILTNEAAERFSFYGMTSILVVFMTQYLMNREGTLSVMGGEAAKAWFHWFNSAVYFIAVIGALISDVWLGKYRTILWFSIVYCLGFLVLAVDQTRHGLFGGLALIALGSGVIKPCVTANVGDQFNKSNHRLIEKVYSWFYFSINLGACISMWACPLLLDRFGPNVGFGVPALFMLLATVAFWRGKRVYVHIPPTGRQVWKDLFHRETLRILGRISVILIFVSMFFALFYQSQGAWVLQAEQMELHWFIDWLPAQIQFVNSLLIMILIPVFSYGIYPAINRIFPLTALRKIGLGLFVTAASFLVPIWIEYQIAAGLRPSIGWQFLAYVFLTAGEIMASITVLEFAYTQAPNRIKSFVMGLYLLSISLGNAFSALVNFFIQNPDGTSKLPGASYYWFFFIAMLLTAVLFVPAARCYKMNYHIQDETES